MTTKIRTTKSVRFCALTTLVALVMPTIVSAQTTLATFIGRIIDVIALAIPIMFALSVLATLFGATILIAGAGNEERMKQGKQILLWGIIFIVVAAGLWSLVFIIQDTFGLR